jgi:hypothetical protein
LVNDHAHLFIVGMCVWGGGGLFKYQLYLKKKGVPRMFKSQLYLKKKQMFFVKQITHHTTIQYFEPCIKVATE